ncbi:prominin-2 [Silurus meridionalis]|uniref:prominin-2 n=1 Tax=Silurus meridionalis TaxID=175797 RepID=UPI001EEC9A24|nr:prominin-2 [Silurus meridionalis]
MGTSTRVILAVLDLLLFLYPCACTQNCSSRIVPSELDGPQIWPVNKPHNGFMSSIIDSFLSSVQPNPFPRELLIKTLNSGGINDKATINEVLRYEAGFLVCVAIGILYIILMPLIGMCFACCRCCGNCGGHMYQKQTNNINCRRQSIYWVTFLITILIFAGNVCMFFSNTYTHKSMNSAPGEFNNTLKNLQSYVTIIPKQIDQVVNESCLVVDNVTYNIQGIGPLLGREIQREIESFVIPALDSSTLILQVIQNTSLLLYTLNSTQKELDLLKSNLTGVKTRLNKTIHNQDCVQCVSLVSELDKLSLNTSINLSSFAKLQSSVDQAEKTDLNKQIQNGRDFFKSIPESVTNLTRDNVQKVQQDLQTIKSQVSQATRDIPLDLMTKFSNILNTVQMTTTNHTPSINMAEKLRQVIDSTGVFPGFQLSQSLGLKSNLTISGVFNDCQMNKSLWKTLHLEDIINLNDYLNVSKYTGQVQQVLQNSNITIPSIVLLDAETKKQLSNFSSTASSVNISSIMQKVTTLLGTNLSHTADKLDALVNIQNKTTVKTELQNETTYLRFIQYQFDSTIKPQLVELMSQLEHISDTMSQINGTVQNVLEKVSSAQDVLNNNTTQTVKSKLTEFVDCQIGVFTSLAKWAYQTITEQVGCCGPVAVTVNTVENLFCSQLVGSLNAFWFSLGWCLVFLIPSIIFSVKLAKFYRRMKHNDEFLSIQNHSERRKKMCSTVDSLSSC